MNAEAAITLNEFLTNASTSIEISDIFRQISTVCKIISCKIRRAGFDNLYGSTSIINFQGEDVKTLDVITNKLFISYLSKIKSVCALISEEDLCVMQVNAGGNYIITFDPLDGSSNIDANINIGSIFGIYKKISQDKIDQIDYLQPGSNLIAAGYCLYGCSTMLVLTLGDNVNIFTLDESVGEFILTKPNVVVPKKTKIYSVNQGNYDSWEDNIKFLVNTMTSSEVNGEKNAYSLRYIGSMVADIHRTLLYGGIFMYPGSKTCKTGKLRYLYEVAPMSLIIEKAGGASVINGKRALDHVPTSIHERVPIFMGSYDCINYVKTFF